jgi:hypothetical protein
VKEIGRLERWALTQRALGNHWLAGTVRNQPDSHDPEDEIPWLELASTLSSLDDSDD